MKLEIAYRLLAEALFGVWDWEQLLKLLKEGVFAESSTSVRSKIANIGLRPRAIALPTAFVLYPIFSNPNEPLLHITFSWNLASSTFIACYCSTRKEPAR
jgi:hypothetical protein